MLSGDAVRTGEDRTYIGFVAAAIGIAVGAGFLLAVVVPLAAAGVGPGESRVPWLIQAHGWAQLQGWAGLFVAGMAFRLVPRFAGCDGPPRPLALGILGAIAVSTVVRTVVQPWGNGTCGDVIFATVAGLGAAGLGGTAIFLVTALLRARRRGPWEAFVWAGSLWWALWAAFSVIAALRAIDQSRLTPFELNDAMTWIVMLGGVGNFIWAVQSRTVPVFFGRKLPLTRTLVPPGLVLNAGLVLILASLAGWETAPARRLEGAGLCAAGFATAGLAPLCGAVWGTAHRLRPRARPAAQFVIAANIAAVVAGMLLAYAGLRTLTEAQYAAPAARDAARHAFGLGVITILIPGMAQLMLPLFATGRALAGDGAGRAQRAVFLLLVTAVLLRVAVALLRGELAADSFNYASAASGIFAWLALLSFGAMVVRALKREPEARAAVAATPRRDAE